MSTLTSTTSRRARKIGGAYQANGTVVAEFLTLAGKPRYVFEFDSPPGLLHIFEPEEVEFAGPPRSARIARRPQKKVG